MRRVGLLALLAALVVAAPAHATFPGQNGKIAYIEGSDTGGGSSLVIVNPDGTGRMDFPPLGTLWSPDGTKIAYTAPRANRDWYEIWTANPDGTGQTRVGGGCLTSPAWSVRGSAWSPDGTKFVYIADCGSSEYDLYTMNSDGSGITRLTDNDNVNYYEPAWSPDGKKIAFIRRFAGGEGIWTMNPDGTGESGLTPPSFNVYGSPDWSPDGSKILFSSNRDCQCSQNDLYSMNRDGSNVTRLTSSSDHDENAHWSPDGTKIVFTRCQTGVQFCFDVFMMNADGTGVRNFGNTGDTEEAFGINWQPIPINSYPRPKGATPLRASLTIAYQPCTVPNRDHGAPLVTGSCNPPQMTSQYLTVGTGDANGMLPRSEGAVRYDVVVDKPATPTDESDVKLSMSMSDVFTKALADYAGELRATVQATDRNNTPNPGGPGAATTQEFPLGFTASCIPTTDTTIGSDCAAATTANALVPGIVKGGLRSLWQLGQVRVFDGGSDDDGDTLADNTLFADEGIFVP
jgi:hypothetical protein